MSQQTAIDWLIDNLPNRFRNAIMNECSDLFEQAKKIEKLQIMEAYINGEDLGGAEQYYNETYNRKQ